MPEPRTCTHATFGSISNATSIPVRKNRSGDKGPNPEAPTTGLFRATVYVFVNLKRQAGERGVGRPLPGRLYYFPKPAAPEPPCALAARERGSIHCLSKCPAGLESREHFKQEKILPDFSSFPTQYLLAARH